MRVTRLPYMAADSLRIDETRSETWQAPGYELYIEFNGEDLRRLSSGLDALWQHPRLDGPFESKASPFSSQQKVEPSTGIDRDVPVHLYGVMQLRTGERIPCFSVAGIWPGCDDALTLCLPAGAIEQLGRDIDEPSPADMAWLAMVDESLAEIAESVFSVTEFQLATIGHGASSTDAASRLKQGGELPSWMPTHLRIENAQLRVAPFKGHS
jgi:hypothetical protein